MHPPPFAREAPWAQCPTGDGRGPAGGTGWAGEPMGGVGAAIVHVHPPPTVPFGPQGGGAWGSRPSEDLEGPQGGSACAVVRAFIEV